MKPDIFEHPDFHKLSVQTINVLHNNSPSNSEFETVDELKNWLREKVIDGTAKKWRQCGQVTLEEIKQFIGGEVQEPMSASRKGVCLISLEIVRWKSGLQSPLKTCQNIYSLMGKSKQDKALERLDFRKKQRETREAKDRIALEARAAGKTFREIGELLGVGAYRATQIYARAQRYLRLGSLTTTQPPSPEPACE